MDIASKLLMKLCLIIFGFLLINIFIPGINGASINTSFLFLMMLLPLIMFFCKIRVTISHIYGFLFLVYCAISLFWTTNFNIGFLIFLYFITLGIAFCLGSAIDNIKPILIGLSFGLILSDFVAFLQYYYNSEIVYTFAHDIAGLFVNKNIYCEVSVVLLLSLIVYRLWFFIPFTLPGIFLVHSRAALLALFIGLIILFWNKHIWKFCLAAIVGMIIVTFYVNNYAEFTLSHFQERVNIWFDTIRGITLFGNGIGSFEITYPLKAIYIDTSFARPQHAHNDLLELVFELGLGVLILIPMFWNILKVKTDEKVILYSTFIISLFSFPLYIPITGFIWLFISGHITRNCADCVEWNESRYLFLKRN